MTYKFKNRASALLQNSITPSSTSWLLQAGGGDQFPFLNPGEVCQAAIISAAGAVEYVTITGISGDTLTVQRAKENTAAQSFPAGSRVEARLTAAVLSDFLQRSGGTMTGNLSFGGTHKIEDFGGFDPDRVKIGAVHAGAIRALDTPLDAAYNRDEDNDIIIPAGGGDPHIFGYPILTTGFFQNIIFIAYVDINNVEPWFKLCDGTNGTPDLRIRFLRGWSGGVGPTVGQPDFKPGETGGDDVRTTAPGGRHNHSGRTGDTILDASNLPSLIVNAPEAGAEFNGSAQGRVTSVTVSYSSGKAHYHLVGEQPDHTHQTEVIPRFFTVAYVMFNLPRET